MEEEVESDFEEEEEEEEEELQSGSEVGTSITDSEAGSMDEVMDEVMDDELNAEAVSGTESEAGSDDDPMEGILDEEMATDEEVGESEEENTSDIEQLSDEELSDESLSEESAFGDELSDNGLSDGGHSSDELDENTLSEEHPAIQIFEDSPDSNDSDNNGESSTCETISNTEVSHKKDTTADDLCQEFSRAKIDNARSDSVSSLNDLMDNLKLKKKTSQTTIKNFSQHRNKWTEYITIDSSGQYRTGFNIIMSNSNSSSDTISDDPSVRPPIRRFKQDFLSRYEKSQNHEVYKILIDCFRLLVDDELKNSTYATAGSSSYAFEAMLDKANISIGRTSEHPLLPSWWDVDERETCIVYARERRSYPNIFNAANATVIANDYNDPFMPQMLRILAEKIYADDYEDDG